MFVFFAIIGAFFYKLDFDLTEDKVMITYYYQI